MNLRPQFSPPSRNPQCQSNGSNPGVLTRGTDSGVRGTSARASRMPGSPLSVAMRASTAAWEFVGSRSTRMPGTRPGTPGTPPMMRAPMARSAALICATVAPSPTWHDDVVERPREGRQLGVPRREVLAVPRRRHEHDRRDGRRALRPRQLTRRLRLLDPKGNGEGLTANHTHTCRRHRCGFARGDHDVQIGARQNGRAVRQFPVGTCPPPVSTCWVPAMLSCTTRRADLR